MKNLVMVPILLGALMLQTVVVSRVQLLYGSADLMLVVLSAWALQERTRHVWLWAVGAAGLVAFVSATPLYWWSITYLVITGAALYLRHRVWQMPVLVLFLVVFVGSLMEHVPVLVWLRLQGANLGLLDGLSLVTLPSAILNLLLVLPVYVLVRSLANQLYAAEEE